MRRFWMATAALNTGISFIIFSRFDFFILETAPVTCLTSLTPITNNRPGRGTRRQRLMGGRRWGRWGRRPRLLSRWMIPNRMTTTTRLASFICIHSVNFSELITGQIAWASFTIFSFTKRRRRRRGHGGRGGHLKFQTIGLRGEARRDDARRVIIQTKMKSHWNGRGYDGTGLISADTQTAWV